MPFFSVVIPSFNRSEATFTAISSVIEQSFDDTEIIVVDDGSSPSHINTLQSSICELNDSRIKLIRHAENKNGAAARNTGIDAAIGKFICFLDSDDTWHVDKLKTIYAIVQNVNNSLLVISHPYAVMSGSLRLSVFPSAPRSTTMPVSEYLFVQDRVGGMQSSTLIVETGLAKQVRFNPRLRGHQDWDFAMRLEQAGGRFEFVDKVLTYRTLDVPGSVASQLNWRFSAWYANVAKPLFTRKAWQYFIARIVIPKAIKNNALLLLILSRIFWTAFFRFPLFTIKCTYSELSKKREFNVRVKRLTESLRNIKAKSVILWGLNNYTENVINVLEQFHVVHIIDNSPEKKGATFRGITVSPLSDVKKTDIVTADAVVLLTDKHHLSMQSEFSLLYNSEINKLISF